MYTKKEYIQSDTVTKAQQALQNKGNSKPEAYASRYEGLLQQTLGQIQDRAPFQYDLAKDPLYQNYRQLYVRQGKQAMEDTVGRAAALTGGYANSYAGTAAQQAYQSYLQELNDRIPELYALALETYRTEGEDLKDRYSLLSQQEAEDYRRYQDLMAQWNSEYDSLYTQWLEERNFDYDTYQDRLDFDYGQYRDQVADSQWQADIDQKRKENALAYEQWLQEFEYQKSQDALKYQQWLQEFQEDQRRYDAQQAASAAKSGRGSGSSGGNKASEEEADGDVIKAQTFVENMLNSAVSSKFDPERVVRTTNALNENQKKEAEKYLKTVLAAGRMK